MINTTIPSIPPALAPNGGQPLRDTIHLGHRDGKVLDRRSDIGLAESKELSLSLVRKPGMLGLHIPDGVGLCDDLCLDVLVIAQRIVVSVGRGGGSVAVGIESRSVLAGDAEDVEGVHATAGRAAGVEVGDVPGERRAVCTSAGGDGDCGGEGRQSDREERGELHGDGWN